MLKRTTKVALWIALLAGPLSVGDEARALDVEDKAPDFTLPSTTGGSVSLHQFRGKQPVLLEAYIRESGAT